MRGRQSAAPPQGKLYLKDDLALDPIECNSGPTAEMARKERLEEMLQQSAIAFLVATAEDEVGDEVRARETSSTRSGSARGGSGSSGSIILHEDGCTLFSNADGVDYIGFPKGGISATYHDVERVLKREGLLTK